MTKLIGNGAEAKITLKDNIVEKNRISKSYRYQELDEKIRKLRTRSESKLMEKVSKLIPVPKIFHSDEKNKTIKMEFVKGKKLSEHLDKLKNFETVCKNIGTNLAKIHDADIIHGDLTTSNIILKQDKVYFIDFGLGFHSSKIEDKAVDLHLIKEALTAKHPKIFEKAYKKILEGYSHSENFSKIIKQLEKVEKRGRYKAQY